MKGLVLEGGGARGSYQIGVCKALFEARHRFDVISGTSVGALNGALIAQGDLAGAYDIWYNMCIKRVVNIDEEAFLKLLDLDISLTDLNSTLKLAKNFIGDKGFDISALKELISERLDEAKLLNSRVDFVLTTFSVSDMKSLEVWKKDMKIGEIASYLLASAYLPIFKREKLLGKHFLDGGVNHNLPLKPLIEKGVEEIIAVRLFKSTIFEKLEEKKDFKGKITYIKPREDLGNIMDFRQGKVRYNLVLGYYDGLKYVKSLLGDRYYVNTFRTGFAFKRFLRINESSIDKFRETMGDHYKVPKRYLLEDIIPRLSNILNAGDNADYNQIFVLLLEKYAELLNLERFKVYSIRDFERHCMRGKVRLSEDARGIKERITGVSSNAFLNRVLDLLIEVY